MPRNGSGLSTLTVNVFPGGFNWGLYVGRDKGFFSGHGIAIEIRDTRDSASQMTDLAAGKFNIAMTAVDNIVAYVEGQGQAPIGPQPDFFAFMGSDSGFLSLVSVPEVNAVADLKGKLLSVDAMATGYAFVLYEILRRSGLDKECGDYGIVGAGGMVQRWTALRERRNDGTLLSAPYNLIARRSGFTELVKAVDVIGPYQGNVAAARRSWASCNSDSVTGFIRGYRELIAWLYNDVNRAEAIAILLQNLPQMTPDVAEGSYGELLHRTFGFFRNCEINAEGLACVLDLRSRYARPKKRLGSPEKYIDRQYFAAA